MPVIQPSQQPDFQAISEAISVKYRAIPGITGSSNSDLDNLPSLPWALVLAPSVTAIERPPHNEFWSLNFPVLLFVDQSGGRGQAVAELLTLIPKVILAWTDGLKLGLEYVQQSYLADSSPDTVDIAGAELPVYRFNHTVDLRFGVTRSS